MEIWIEITIYIVSLLLFLPCVFYYMNMFQQNSYRPRRFLRWLRQDPLPHFFRKAKLKFVFTHRMRRLQLVEVLLFVLSALLSPFAALACAFLSPAILLLSNLLLSPVEKAINRYFYKDAKSRLEAHKGLVVIGITGSYGKTSTKHYLYRILSEKYNVLMTPGNFNTTLGVVRTIREQLQPFHQIFIVEMGAKQRGDIKEICELVHPQIGIVTSVGKMHLETFGSLENIQKTKFELLEALPSDGYGVYNAESEGIASYKGIPSHCRLESYGIDAHRCDVRAANLLYDSRGMSFDLIDSKGMEHYQSKLLGKNNVLNLCAALMVASHRGRSPEQRRRAVSKIQSVEHRLSISHRGSLTILDDAYNSNPEGAAMALGVLKDMSLPEGGKRIVITPGFVELGPLQWEECRKLGYRSAKTADILVIVNKLNREAIYSGAIEGGLDEKNIICADTLSDALIKVSSLSSPGSVLLYENDLPDMFK